MDYKSVGQRIKKERIRKGLTQAQLAESIEVSCAFIGQLERGERGLTVGTLIALSNYLGVTTDYLLMNDLNAPQNAVSEQIRQIVANKPVMQQQMIFDMLQTMFSYLENGES